MPPRPARPAPLGLPRVRAAAAATAAALLGSLLLAAPGAQAATYAKGIDVSHYDGQVAWKKVRAAGYVFAFAKATEGESYADATYATNHAGARAAGIRIGAYHFALPGGTTTASIADDAEVEASHFLDVARPAPGDLAPVLDLERSGGLSAAELSSWVGTWLRAVERRVHVKPIIYSGHTWYEYMDDTTVFADAGYKLWRPHYTTAAGPDVPADNWGGNGWTFWQWTSTASVPGISGDVDADRFAGRSFADLTIPRPPKLVSVPLVTGTMRAGFTLNGTTGEWTGTAPILYGFSWQRCDSAGAGCYPVEGVANDGYRLQAADVGHTMRVEVTAHNAAGTVKAISGETGVIRPPDTTAPSRQGVVKLSEFEVARGFAVSWHAADSETGVASYDVRYRSASQSSRFGGYVRLLHGTRSGDIRFVGRQGSTYCFSVRAADRAGNVSAWSAERCTAIPLDDRALGSVGRWSGGSGSAFYLKTYSSDSTKSATLSKTMRAKRVALVALRCPTCGKVAVAWNGTRIATIPLHSALPERSVIPLPAFPRPASGKLTVTVVSSGKRVVVDAVGASAV